MTVVIITRDRSASLHRTLERLRALPERPPMIVVDNGSTDATPAVVERAGRGVRLVRAASNLGAAGRNLGVEGAQTPYVAFSDDDSWWAPHALSDAARLFDGHPRLGLLAACLLVGSGGRRAMRANGAKPLAAGAAGVAWVLRERTPVDPPLQEQLVLLDRREGRGRRLV